MRFCRFFGSFASKSGHNSTNPHFVDVLSRIFMSSDLSLVSPLSDSIYIPQTQTTQEALFPSLWSRIKPQTEGWDRTFFDLSSKCLEPLCWSFEKLRYRLFLPLNPHQFDNRASRFEEVAVRILEAVPAVLFLTAGFFIALGLGIAGKIFRAIAFGLQKEGVTHIQTGTLEKSIPDLPRVAVWNVCGIAGGMHYDHGGVNTWKARLEKIVKMVRDSDSDVCILQEIYDGALAEALIQHLKGDFAHIYTHMGNTLMGNVGGLMILSKCAVHKFTHEEFHNDSWQLKRGFATVEVKKDPSDPLPCARIIGTHLIHDSPKNRAEQVAQIVSDLAKRQLDLPTVIGGDLNIEFNSKERSVLDPYFEHGDFGLEPTCTNRLVAQWDPSKPPVPEEKIDYISVVKKVALPEGSWLAVKNNVQLTDCRMIQAFDESYDTKTAVSDHHLLVAQMRHVE